VWLNNIKKIKTIISDGLLKANEKIADLKQLIETIEK
jgi:hypothetical protein